MKLLYHGSSKKFFTRQIKRNPSKHNAEYFHIRERNNLTGGEQQLFQNRTHERLRQSTTY